MERRLIGQGNEHWVYLDQYHPGNVIKVPKPRALLSLFIAGINAYSLIDEFKQAQTVVKNTTILIPETKVIILREGKSYRLLQRYIPEDLSISNIQAYLERFATPFLTNKYFLDPTNFRSYINRVYWLDPTKGAGFTRVLEKSGILSWGEYTALKAKIKRKLT